MANSSVDTQDYYFGKGYDGSDIKINCELTLNGKTSNFELGAVNAIHVVTQTEIVPRFEMGKVDPVGLTKGKRAISGTIVFPVIDQSVIEEIKMQIGVTVDGTVSGKRLDYIDQLPPLTFVITADNENTKATKRILGVQLFNNSSAVGLNTIGAVEQCQFIAQDITPLEIEE